MAVRLIHAEVMEGLRQLDDESVHCIVTSPPYFSLRSYLPDDHPMKPHEIGSEPTVGEYVDKLVAVFREARRVLRKDGVCWLNLGDSYASFKDGKAVPDSLREGDGTAVAVAANRNRDSLRASGLKAKDLIGVPWRVALALQADGWWLRSDIIWSKPNPLPQSVRDRCTASHEHIFMLTKSERYFFDAEAIVEPAVEPERQRNDRIGGANGLLVRHSEGGVMGASITRNRRTVWTIATQAFADAHFATMPTDLVELCVKAGSSERGCCSACAAPLVRETEISYENPGNRTTNGPRSVERRHETPGFAQRLEKRVATLGFLPSCACDANAQPCTILDPFSGVGTTVLVADRLQRHGVGIELNEAYIAMARKRIDGDRGGLLDLMEAHLDNDF